MRTLLVLSLVLSLVVMSCGQSTPPPQPPPQPPSGVGSSPAVAPTPAAIPTTQAEGLGTLVFPVTGGTPAARHDFEQGVLAMHSFWYDEAQRRFTLAMTADPKFAMAYWGLAMSYSKLLFADDNVEAARAVLAKLPALDKVSARERAWIDAARALFAPEDAFGRRRAFLGAMERMHRDYPDDDEISVFLALALISDNPGTPPETTLLARAGSLALEVLARNPQHPGAAHYVIHAFDRSDLAALALPAAKKYAKIAGAAFHARHMPAHIFGRLGMWSDAQQSCQSAWDVSLHGDALRRDFHSLSWLIPLGFELGRRGDAEAALKTYADSLRAGTGPGQRLGYLEVVATYLTVTEEWTRLDELLAPLKTPAIADPDVPTGAAAPPFAAFEQMLTSQLRAQVAAEQKDSASVARHLDVVAQTQPKLRPFLEGLMGKEGYAAQAAKQKVESAQGRMILLARARRDPKAMIAPLQKLVAVSDEHPDEEPGVMGGSPHEELARALTDAGRTKEALAELRIALKRHPNRGRTLLAAARAASKLGEPAAAYDYYAQVVEVWQRADAATAGLDEAKQAVAKGRPVAAMLDHSDHADHSDHDAAKPLPPSCHSVLPH